MALLVYYVKLFILGSTPRSIYNIKYTLPSVNWGTLWPVTTLLVVISLTYSIISPVINGLTCFSFFLFYQLYKYQFLWQIDQPKSSETGGLFFPSAMQHIFVGMYIQQICLAALFFLAQDQNGDASAIPEGALMVVLIAFTIFFHLLINNSYGPLIHALPLSLADQIGADANRAAAEQELRDGAETADGHSAASGDVEELSAEKAPRASTGSEKGKASLAASPVVPAAAPAVEEETDPATANPPEIAAPEEDVGPKEFYHPASVEPQRVVWIPRDELGLAEEEEKAIRAAGIEVSLEGAKMDGKGHVDITGAPPGGEVRVL